MKREEAQQLLELCHPGHASDRHDPALAEAFALLETDAELKAWFEQQQALDARISQSINLIEPPADFKTSILAGMHLHAANSAENSEEEAAIPFPPTFLQEETQTTRNKAWWLHPWTGIAALFLFMMVILNVPKNESTATETATAGLPPVMQFLSQKIDSLKAWHFDKRDDRADNLQTFLTSRQAPSPASIPDCLDKLPTIGCITFEFENTKLSMICFKKGRVYHLITADKATYPDALPDEPQVFECKNKAFRIWVEGEQVKILSVSGTKEDIPEFN